MKLVRKFIRLFPIIYLLFVFAVLIFNENIWVGIEGENLLERVKNVLSTIDFNSYSSAWSYGIRDVFNGFYGPFQILYDFIEINIVDGGPIMYMIFGICCYELWCSLIFLLFDVFGFIFNVAEEWLEKGRRLNE